MDVAYIISLFLTNKDVSSLKQTNKEWNSLMKQVCYIRMVYLIEKAMRKDIPFFSFKSILGVLGNESTFIVIRAKHLPKLDKPLYYYSEDDDNYKNYPYVFIYTGAAFSFKKSDGMFIDEEGGEYLKKLCNYNDGFKYVDFVENEVEYMHKEGYCMMKIIYHEEGSKFRIKGCGQAYILNRNKISYVSRRGKIYNLNG